MILVNHNDIRTCSVNTNLYKILLHFQKMYQFLSSRRPSGTIRTIQSNIYIVAVLKYVYAKFEEKNSPQTVSDMRVNGVIS